VDFQNKEKNVHGNLIISFEIYRDDVILVWNSLYWEFDRFTSLDLEKSLLNVEDTHKWLIDEFIPLVIYDYERKKYEERFLYKIFNFMKINKTLTFHDFIKNFKVEEYVKSDYKQNDIEFYLIGVKVCSLIVKMIMIYFLIMKLLFLFMRDCLF
ncbi:hypothetical protein ACMT1V_000774, partial [Campylobacter jejuni]